MSSPAYLSPLPGFDVDTLARLVELDPSGRLGVMGRIFRTYDSTARRLGLQLEEQRHLRDGEALIVVVHSLKSSSGNVGATELQRRCHQLEVRVRSGQTVEWEAEIDHIESELATVLASVRAILTSL